MKSRFIAAIERDFACSEKEDVVAELSSLSKNSIMANSELNLDKTIEAILAISKGDFAKLVSLVVAAKSDFRDVIYWASLE